MTKKSNFVTYKAAGGIVINNTSTHVLLLIRPALDEVRLPKGHIEADETIKAAALREVTEETGYDDVKILADLGKQLVVFPLGEEIVRRTEYYFLMRARSQHQIERPKADKQQFFPVWVEWEEALKNLTFEAEREWIRRAKIAEQSLRDGLLSPFFGD